MINKPNRKHKELYEDFLLDKESLFSLPTGEAVVLGLNTIRDSLNGDTTVHVWWRVLDEVGFIATDSDAQELLYETKHTFPAGFIKQYSLDLVCKEMLKFISGEPYNKAIVPLEETTQDSVSVKAHLEAAKDAAKERSVSDLLGL